jgi:hypothetical protein
MVNISERSVIAPKKGTFEEQGWKIAKTELKKWLKGRLREVRCPKHQERPRVTVTGSIQNPQINIAGCCQDLMDEATKRIT